MNTAERLSRLPEEKQERLAARILEALEAEEKTERLFRFQV